jgi:hypothetical protein
MAVEVPVSAGTRPDEPRDARRRPPVLGWAAVGALFCALEIVVLVAWLTSDSATPSPGGLDPLPSSTHAWLLVFQTLSVALGVVAVIYAVHTSRRERRLSFDAMLLIAWLSVWWQDPLLNYLRPQAFYNAHMVDLGSWSEQIPGWILPNGSNFPEPFTFSLGVYFWMVFCTMLCATAMRTAKRLRPDLGAVGVFLCGFAAMIVLDLVLELTFIRTGVYAYPGVVRSLSIWGGETYQFPLYESFFWPAFWAAGGALRYFRDDKGRSVVERGVEELRVGKRARVALSVLAICGFFNVGYLVIYNVPMNWISLHVDTTPRYPSYLSAGICGPGTGYDCAGPRVPVPLPESPPPHPDDVPRP